MHGKKTKWSAWLATCAVSTATCAVAAPAPTYTLVEVDRGALRTDCPVINDAGVMAFAYRDQHTDEQPADGVVFWSENRGLFTQWPFRNGEVLGKLVGLTGTGAVLASMVAGPTWDFTGVALIRARGQLLSRPPRFFEPMLVSPLAVTDSGAMLLDGSIDGTAGAFVAWPRGHLRHLPIPYLSEAKDLNEAGATIGGAWVDGENRFASFWRSPEGTIQVLKSLPGAGAHGQTRAYALNNLNAIVGVTIAETGRMVATLWDSPTSAPRELVAPEGGEEVLCSASGINDRGEVVGNCSKQHGDERRAFYWAPGTGMTPLSKLLPPSAVAAGAQVLENGCASINNQGRIAFSLVDEGSSRGVPAVLKPAP